MKTLASLTFIATLLASVPFNTYASATAQGEAVAGTEQMSEGEIRKVNKDAKKLTIKHGELKNLDMPPMTMVFQVQDPAMLEMVKAGDKVSFVAEKVGGQFTVTRIDVKP